MTGILSRSCIWGISSYRLFDPSIRLIIKETCNYSPTCLYHSTTRRRGILTEGETMSFPEIQQLAKNVKRQAAEQFIMHYHRTKNLNNYEFLWGDEVETMLVKFDHDRKRVRVALRQGEVIERLKKQDKLHPYNKIADWMYETTRFQIENIPAVPFTDSLHQLCQVETSMRKRQERIQACLGVDEVPATITTFPRLGCGTFTHPIYRPSFSAMLWKSMFLPDEIVCPSHPRYSYLSRNMPLRRGEKMHANIPIYKDINVPRPFIEDLSQYGDNGTCQALCLPNHIYMDSMLFGSANCCLQVTFQAKNLRQACHLYDQLIPVCAITMALAAGSPVHRGYLSDIDTRWPVLCQAWDDRSHVERGEHIVGDGSQRLMFSRSNQSHHYISEINDGYNDVSLDYDQSNYELLLSNGVEELLARHIAHLMVRDPVCLYKDNIEQDAASSIEHLENLNTSYWQSLRLKYPSIDTKSGWRVEFRPLDLQVSDYENAAFALFMVLLTRAILKYDLNFVIPISRVLENTDKSSSRDAVLTQKFYFRRQVASEFTFNSGQRFEDLSPDDECSTMTIDEIINGRPPTYYGLLHYIRRYVWSLNAPSHQKRTVLSYMDVISKRASGEMKTTARNMRDFLIDHPHYQHDSVVTERMNYDLLMNLVQEDSGAVSNSGAWLLRA